MDFKVSDGYKKVSYDFDNIRWLLSPREQLGLKGAAIGLISLPPDEGYTFTHNHKEQEEVYIVIEGSGSIYLDGELMDIERGDIIRVDPHVRRALKAGPEGMFIICSGGIPSGYPKNPNARYLIDDGSPYYDDIPPWYAGNEDVKLKNMELKKRMNKRLAKER